MGFSFDSNEVDPDKIGKGSAPFATKAGRCHLMLVEFDEYGDSKNGRHIAKYEILAHEHDDQCACIVWDYLSDPSPQHKDGGETARHILCERAEAFGLLSDEIIRKLKSEGKPIAFDLNDAVGRQCFANLTLDKGESRDFLKVRSTLHVNDEKAAKYPRNSGMLAKATRGERSNLPKGDGGKNGDGGNVSVEASPADPFASVT